MINKVLHVLLDRGLVSDETVITAKIARRNRHGMTEYSMDDYTILEQRHSMAGRDLTLRSVIGERRITATEECITAIDGMSIER